MRELFSSINVLAVPKYGPNFKDAPLAYRQRFLHNAASALRSFLLLSSFRAYTRLQLIEKSLQCFEQTFFLIAADIVASILNVDDPAILQQACYFFVLFSGFTFSVSFEDQGRSGDSGELLLLVRSVTTIPKSGIGMMELF